MFDLHQIARRLSKIETYTWRHQKMTWFDDDNDDDDDDEKMFYDEKSYVETSNFQPLVSFSIKAV